MEKWNERLLKAMNARGAINADLVRATKQKSSSVSDWLSGETKMLNGENAALVCRYLHINVDWLFFGALPSGLEDGDQHAHPAALGTDIAGDYCPPDDRRHDLRRDGDRRRDGEVDIPRLNRAGSMGPGAAVDAHEYPVGYMRVEMPWLRKNVDYSRPDNLALIDGRGGSMEPTYRDGDILLVDRGQTNLDIDAVYVLVELATGELFIKGIQRMGLKNYLMISHAPTNRDVPIGDGSGYQVIGRVVYAWNGKKL